jgi:hypothetical protein
MTRAITLTFLAALAGAALLADAAQAQQPRVTRARAQAVAQPLPGPLVPVAVPPTFDPAVASLPPRCPEGRTRTGECVHPILGQIARRTAVVATQARLSKSGGPPAMPMYDPYYRYPNAIFADLKRDLDLEYGRRASSYVPQPYHPYGGPGTPFPYTYPIFFH